VLTDGWPVGHIPLPHLAIKKGDAVTASVAAASIVAKVTRDRIMDRYHRRFPQYGFDTNRGYGTAFHWRALEEHGPSPIHRLSFKGVASLLREAELASYPEMVDPAALEEAEAVGGLGGEQDISVPTEDVGAPAIMDR
jgi:ribonuclease HII